MVASSNNRRTLPQTPLPSGSPFPRQGVPQLFWSRARLRTWRNRIIASASFRKWAMRLPFLRRLSNRKAAALFRLTAGFVFSQVLSTCVRLGVFDALKNGPLPANQLARSCGIAPETMQLLLEQAERLDLVIQTGPDAWMLADAGAVVAADPGITQMILHHDMFYRDLEAPLELLKAPGKDTRLKTFWAYAHGHRTMDLDEATAQTYSALMQTSQSMLADCILDAYDFSRHTAVLDIGGGDGSFLAACASRHPDLFLHLLDLPAVAGLARQNLADKGLAGRARIHAGDFVSSPLPGMADCACLVRILCDHDDDRVVLILNNLHAALKPGTQVVVAEAMAGPSEGARLAAVYFSFYFLAMGSGRCRSDKEIKALLSKAGFKRPRTVKTHTPLLATLVVAVR